MNIATRSAPRIYALVVMCALAMGATGAATQACTPAQRADARTVLDIAKTTCILANVVMPDQRIAEVCGIANDLYGPMQQILGEARAGRTAAASEARTAALAEKGAGCPACVQQSSTPCASTKDGGGALLR